MRTVESEVLLILLVCRCIGFGVEGDVVEVNFWWSKLASVGYLVGLRWDEDITYIVITVRALINVENDFLDDKKLVHHPVDKN